MLFKVTVPNEVAQQIREQVSKSRGYAIKCKTCGHWSSAHHIKRKLKILTCRVKGCNCQNYVMDKIPL